MLHFVFTRHRLQFEIEYVWIILIFTIRILRKIPEKPALIINMWKEPNIAGGCMVQKNLAESALDASPKKPTLSIGE